MLYETRNPYSVPEKAWNEAEEDIHRSSLSLHASHITVDGSRFRKTVGEFIMLPGNTPEPNLDVLSLVSSQHTVGCDNLPSHS